jgi:cyclomaltodextrinase / maltogenic alpha-amylase / neopullulanase
MGCSAATSVLAQPACQPDPLGGRSAYLRGSFNAWAAPEAQRFTWACNRFELVTRLNGEHSFKIGDEGWSADADFGSADGVRLVPRGPEIKRRFAGTYRFTVTMTDTASQQPSPQLKIEACPAGEPPLGATALFLRGTLNNWAALDDYQFLYSCDAYYLNVKASGRHEFKIADAAWLPASTIGPEGAAGQNAANFAHVFQGAPGDEYTMRLAWAGNRPVLDIGPKSFADPRAAAVTDPAALSLAFDSRSSAHKQPFGAVTAGSTVSFALTSAPGVERVTLVIETRRLEGNQEVLQYTEQARVPMQRGESAAGVRWTAGHRFDTVAVYGYWFEAQIGGKTFAFQNNSTPVHWTREKGAGGLGAVSERPANPGGIRRFRQTVYAPDFAVPEWAPDVIYYYVFPDRFRNGNPKNDPKPGRDKYQKHGIEFHASWLDKPYKPGTGDKGDAIYNNDFFGGDLQGIIDKLDYIKDLGANTIYMTPVFRAASNHKYDTADYKQIDPAFGSNADFDRLTREAAKRGIRVIPDASLNHTGSDSIYFDRYGNFKSQGAFEGGKPNPKSPYFGWYSFDTTQSDPDKQFKGWVGVTDLPELDKASPGWRDFAYRAKDSVTRHWLRRGASGWRMDVAPWVSDDFWREWRRAVKETRPDALTVAETWFDSSKYFLGDMFDSTMNYVFRNAVQEYAAGGSALALAQQLEHLREAYPPPAFHALMNLLSSHDQARALHVFGWHDDTKDPAAIERAKQRLKLAVLLQMTYPGAPTIYYGDEVGVTGGDDPFNRATYPWADQGGKPDLALLADFKRFTKLRNEHAVLRRGSMQAPLFADEHVLVLLRRLGDTWAITATNNAGAPRSVVLPLPAGMPPAELKDALGGAPVAATAQGLGFEVPALSGRVLILEP